MGDTRRFSLMADLISRNALSRDLRVADVAGGKGYLQSELYRKGFRNVISFDKRKGMARGRKNYRYEWFTHDGTEPGYELVVAMHPDEGTDHAILYAARHRISCIICPCCIKPHGAEYRGKKDFEPWVRHLKAMAEGKRMTVSEAQLPMRGRNLVLICKPVKASA
jgi:hypothetical protein